MNEYVTTGDGTITLLDKETGELYHNRAGAFTEALENYVRPSGALDRLRANRRISVLDVCFGLGYNTLVLLQQAVEANVHGMIDIVGIESNADVIAATSDVLQAERFANLRKFLGCDDFATKYRQIAVTFAGLQISMNLRHADVRAEVPALNQDFDYVFHDPFSAKKVPELWSIELFHEYYRLLKNRQGCVLTYSVAPATRASLAEAGFEVYRTSPVGEKKGGTLGSVGRLKQMPPNVQNLSDDDRAKLRSKSAIPYRDPHFTRSRVDIVRARESEQAT